MDLKFLESKKSTQALPKIQFLLEFVHNFPGIYEGEGGQEDDWGCGRGQPGTGLRSPWGPLYDMPFTWRKSLLNFCIKKGVLRVEKETDYYVTDLGKQVLEELACKNCHQIRRAYKATRIDRVLRWKSEAISLMCQCEYKKRISPQEIEGIGLIYPDENVSFSLIE